MQVEQVVWTARDGWDVTSDAAPVNGAQIVFAFGAPEALSDAQRYAEIRERYPGARIASCTTGGEIHDKVVLDNAISVSALSFDKTETAAVCISVGGANNSRPAGVELGRKLKRPGLKLAFVLSDGTSVNGSELIRGLREVLGDEVAITGGLAGDGPRFEETRVGLDEVPEPGRVVGIGFYGSDLHVSHGCQGGWDVFGPERRITRADGNVLFELDGKPALELYKKYLGDEAKGLPGSALLFPLRVYAPGQKDAALVRTIVGIDEARQAMIFAGDTPEGHCCQLMRGNIDRLVDGAVDAAQHALNGGGENLAILVSCIGRKLLLGQRTAEEVEAVKQVLGPKSHVTGFYSYGEISPHASSGFCDLHNQTMTITVIAED